MSRKNRFVEKLEEAQKRALEKGYKSGKHFLFRRKCQCILLSDQGKTIGELSELFGVSRLSITKWLNLWQSQGIEGLDLKPGRGRPAKLRLEDENQIQRVKMLVENEPKNLNRVVGQLKEELDIELSKKTLKRFLKNLNTSGSAFAKD